MMTHKNSGAPLRGPAIRGFLGAVALIIAATILLPACDDTGRDKAERAQQAMALRAAQAVPIPNISYFQEKRTIAKWAERWDKPAIVTYVYLVSYGTIIGYYVADGKPASTRSYLMPEESYYSEGVVLTNPDIDGTYGENNPGIRFFTAEGTAVEWGGSGASYIYSDAPLPLSVPRLNTKAATDGAAAE